MTSVKRLCLGVCSGLLLMAPVLATSQVDAVPFSESRAERLTRTIFERGLVEYQLASVVEELARVYVADTVYEGRVRVNKPPKSGDLTIVLFRHSDGLSNQLKGNCHAFAREAIILCDHDYLGSFPLPWPVVSKKDDPIEHSLLIQWAIGHEIAHVIFGDSRADSSPYDSAIELLADRFASQGIVVRSESTWGQLWPQLTNAIYWMERQHNELTQPNVAFSQEGLRKYRFEVRRDRHPPLFARLVLLLKNLQSTYSSFPLGVPNPSIEVEVDFVEAAKHDVTEVTDWPNYNDARLTESERIRVHAEQAMSILVGADPRYAAGHLNSVCGFRPNVSEPTRSLVLLVCSLGGRSPASNDATTKLSSCSNVNHASVLTCLGVSAVAINACSAGGRLPMHSGICQGNPRETLAQHLARPLSYSADGGLPDWIVPQLYEAQARQLDAAALNQWVLQMASELRSSRLAQHASILLAHHLRRTLDPLMRMEFLRIKRSADMAAGDKRAAMAAGLELATLSEVHLREDLVSIGSAWYMLGRIGMSEATWLERRNHAFADAMVQVPAAKRAATSSSESLAAAAQQLLRAAAIFERGLEADGAKLPSDARDQFLVGYINATSSALKALNMLRKDTTAALNLSRALAGKLAAVQTIPVHEGFDYESDCLAPSLVNIAVGELAAQSGDAGRALDSIKRAVLIQEKSADRADVDALRTLSYALYAAGDLTRARYVAEEAARRWSKSTGRAYSDSQMMVGGKNISLEALLRGQ